MASLLNMSGGSLLSKGLPYDAEIEYLESTGTQYINTGIVSKSSIDLYMDFQLTSNISDDRKLIGADGCVGFAIRLSKWRIIGSTFISTSVSTDTNRHIFRTEGKNYYLDNTQISTSNRYSMNLYIYIFHLCKNNQPDGYGGKMKIYECKIFDNSTLVMHLIPVRVGTTGYMYDRVSGTLFGNAGTGSFILGPDKTN